MTYSDFLKMNPYHGMKVSFEWDGEEIDDAELLQFQDTSAKITQWVAYKEYNSLSSRTLVLFTKIGTNPFTDNIEDLTNLKPMTNNTHPLADLKAGDYLKTKEGHYRRVLLDVQHPELGELATVLVSIYDRNKNHDDLKRASSWETLFEVIENGWEKETTRTIDDVLATLSDEDRKIVEEKIK